MHTLVILCVVCNAGEEATTEQKGKSLQTTRKGRGEKAGAAKADVDDDTSTKKIASEDDQKPSVGSGRPKRGKQSAATPVVNEKPAAATPKRCGKSRGQSATENKEAETSSSECTLEAESSSARGAKRKREEAEEMVEQGKEETVTETGSPKKSKNEEDSTREEEVEKMEVETIDEIDQKEAETPKEEKAAAEPVAMTVQEEPKQWIVDCVPLEESDKGTVDESKPLEKVESEEEPLTSGEPASSGVKENGTAKTNEETASLNIPLNMPGSEVKVQETAEEVEKEALPSQKVEETLRNGTDDFQSNDDALLARKFIWCKGEEASPSILAQTFSIVSYNILADYHAQRDYAGPNSWITKEHLAVDYRHSRLMKEICLLDSDILCLQEVQTDYFISTLKPALAE